MSNLMLALSLMMLLTAILQGPSITTTMALTTTNKLHSLVGRYNSTLASATSSIILALNKNNHNRNHKKQGLSSKDDNGNDYDDDSSTPISRESNDTPGIQNGEVVEDAMGTITPPPMAVSNSARATSLRRDDEPNLYNLPTTLHLAYRSVPILVQCLMGVTSICLLSIFKRTTTLSSASTISSSSSSKAAAFGWKILLDYPVLYFAELVQKRNIRSMIRFGLEVRRFGCSRRKKTSYLKKVGADKRT
jgi:hypothetical protein